jgi:hypothetical protein
MDELKDITGDGVCVGMRFGKFTVVGKKRTKTHIMWDCVCECGRHRNYGGDMILIEKQREDRFQLSCGFCKISPPVKEYKTRRRIYSVWHDMKDRCGNPNSHAYKHYGGRGIKVCDEWKTNFNAFYDYVSKLEHFAEPGRSIDRIDNNGDYCTGNVRWATAKEQANNKRPRKKRGLSCEQRTNRSKAEGNQEI